MAKQVEEKRRSYVSMMLATVGCIVVGFLLLHYLVFDPTVKEAPKPKDEPQTADAGPQKTPETSAKTESAAKTEPAKTESAKTDAAKTDETPAAKSDAPAGTVQAASGSDLAASGTAVSFRDAKFIPLAVGTAAEKNGYTAVFSERGGVLAVLRYVDKDGKVVYARTPANPGDRPDPSSRDEALMLLGPTPTLPTWSKIDGEWKPERPKEFTTAFPDEVDPAKERERFDNLWPEWTGGQFGEDKEGDAGQEGRAAFGFEGTLAWLNTRKWTAAEAVSHDDASRTVRFTHATADGRARFDKTFTVLPGFKIVCNIEVTNLTAAEKPAAFPAPLNIFGPCGIRQDLYKTLTEGPVALYAANHGLNYKDCEGQFGDSIVHAIDKYAEHTGQSAYIRTIPADHLFDVDTKEYRVMLCGLSTGYFLAVAGPDYLPDWDEAPGANIHRLKGHPPEGTLVATTYNFPAVTVAPGATVSRRLCMYAGPRDRKAVQTAFRFANPINEKQDEDSQRASWSDIVAYGWTSFIAAPITGLLRWLIEVVGSGGLAIICLTLIVRLAISPLSVKAQKTMQIHGHKMRQIKPKLDAVKEKYKGDKSREAQLLQFQETRAVMKSNNVSMIPLGGCLILLLQMPIFFALYSSVRTSFMLRHEDFLWIHDLARPDAIFGAIQSSSMWLGFFTANGFITLNLLPLIWVALLIIQQRSQPSATDPQQAKMQKQMAFIMPLMGIFFYNMPAGFTLYFVASSIYSFAESRLVKWWLIRKGLIDPHAGVAMGAGM
jgi:YidC/Oxa1 family membrane protein insertase